MIPIFEPYLGKSEKDFLVDAIDSGWISSQGKYIEMLEKELCNYHAVDHCVVTSSCTTALHLSLLSLDISPGDEVICPALTFIAPANMVKLCGAKLVLVDIDQDTMTIDPSLIERAITKKTKAIIVVHQFGHSAHMDEILQISKRNNISVIEDNAESIGGKYKGKLLGTIGDLSTLSFFGNKIITSGEGGAVITNRKELADKARILRDHGQSREIKYDFILPGYNYRMTNLQAAIGYAQVGKLGDILTKRKNQMELYYQILEDEKKISLRKFANWTTPVHWLLTLSIDNVLNTSLIIKKMREKGIECRPMIGPVYDAKHFRKMFDETEFPNARNVSQKFFHLPSATSLTKQEIEFICNHLSEIIN